jgi:hypothetical protein
LTEHHALPVEALLMRQVFPEQIALLLIADQMLSHIGGMNMSFIIWQIPFDL